MYPLPDLPAIPCVIVTPEIGVLTPRAFADWDALRRDVGGEKPTGGVVRGTAVEEPTGGGARSRTREYHAIMNGLGRVLCAWLSDVSGASARGRSRAESLLLDLVRTGIENDFEKVVFPQYPELRDIKRVLERAGAFVCFAVGVRVRALWAVPDARGSEAAVARVEEIGRSRRRRQAQ